MCWLGWKGGVHLADLRLNQREEEREQKQKRDVSGPSI